jgi:hypothetical protein
MIKEVSLYSSK